MPVQRFEGLGDSGRQARRADLAVAPIVPPGSTLYVAKRGDSVAAVAHHFIGQTSYLTSSELAEAIRKANGDFRGHS